MSFFLEKNLDLSDNLYKSIIFFLMSHIFFTKGAICLKEIDVIIDTEEIAEFFFRELLKRGFVPTEDEIEELADITFEYLLDKCIIDEETEE